MHKIWWFVYLFIFIPVLLFSTGSREGIIEGNNAYKTGNFDKALSLYEEAEIDTPESPHIYFNKGLAFFRLEEYEKAKDAFLSAASKTTELSLEAKAYYNLGNTSFFEAGRHVESDLEKAISLYQEAISHYQVAIERDETLTDAAHNIEVTRLIVQDLLDKLKKQQEQNAEQQEKIEEIAKKLAELIEREGRQIEATLPLEEEKETKGITASLKNRVKKIKTEQENIRKETVDVSGKLDELISQGANQQGGAPQGPAPQGGAQFQQAKEHVELSINYQHLSENQLQKTALVSALESEGNAREELIKALESLVQPQDQQQQQEQQEQQNQEDQQKKEEQQKQAEDAEDIIDEEREEERERQVQGQSGYREVEKDW